MQGIDLGSEQILAAIDARMGEIYCAKFQWNADGLVDASSEEIVIAPEAYQYQFDQMLVGVGTGFAANHHALQQALGSKMQACKADALPHAADIAKLAARDYASGKMISPDLLEPAYLRNKVALTLEEQGK
jgi:tRNA threonylcarbamoyladenosine biosynthesis protein TsaB